MEEDFNIQSDERFAQIIEQSKSLFFEFGIRSLSMDDISRKLGISKKTLYQYVSNKEELVEKVLKCNCAKFTGLIDPSKIDSQNAIDMMFSASLLVYEQMQTMNPMLIFELEKYYGNILDSHIENKKKTISEQIKRNIELGISQGLYRKNISVDLITNIYVVTLMEMHNTDLCKTLNISFEKVFEVMFENHIRSIATPEGIVYFEKRKPEIEALFNQNTTK